MTPKPETYIFVRSMRCILPLRLTTVQALIKEKTHICEPFLRFVIKFIDWQIC